jgi:hypothetical protein
VTRYASTATATNSTRQRVSHRRLRPPCPCLLALCLPLCCPSSLSSFAAFKSPFASPQTCCRRHAIRPPSLADATKAHPSVPVTSSRTSSSTPPRSDLARDHTFRRTRLPYIVAFPLLNPYVSFISLSVKDPSPCLASSLYVSLAPDIERYRSFRLLSAVAHQHFIHSLPSF